MIDWSWYSFVVGGLFALFISSLFDLCKKMFKDWIINLREEEKWVECITYNWVVDVCLVVMEIIVSHVFQMIARLKKNILIKRKRGKMKMKGSMINETNLRKFIRDEIRSYLNKYRLELDRLNDYVRLSKDEITILKKQLEDVKNERKNKYSYK